MKTQFRNHEKKITAGERLALEGWWDAACECRVTHVKKNGKPNASAYASDAARVAQDNTEGTIARMVQAVLKAQDTINADTNKPFKVGDFKGVNHLLATVSGGTSAKKSKPKSNYQKAEALLDTLSGAEIRRLLARFHGVA